MATELSSAALNVSRVKLLKRLKDTLTERREERTAKRAKARTGAQEQIDRFVAQLTAYVENASASELRNLEGEYEDRANHLERMNENETRLSADHGQDESLERAIRALEMSEDKTIEVAPTDDLYRLL